MLPTYINIYNGNINVESEGQCIIGGGELED